MACFSICKSQKNMSDLIIEDKGTIDFKDCYEEMITLVKSNPTKSYIWSLEHHNVYTIGISDKETKENLETYPKIVKTDRGGKITFHGPGQLVFYFMLNLQKISLKPTELTKFILKQTSDVIEKVGCKNNINLSDPGIYIGHLKLASIGMRIKNKVTYHGISINFDMDLDYFDKIKPCGLNVKACNLCNYTEIEKIDLIDKLKKAYRDLII